MLDEIEYTTISLYKEELRIEARLHDGRKCAICTIDPEFSDLAPIINAGINDMVCSRTRARVSERRPMGIFFKQVQGRDYICHGEFYTDLMHHLPQFFVAEDPHFAPKVKITDPNMVVWHLGRG